MALSMNVNQCWNSTFAPLAKRPNLGDPAAMGFMGSSMHPNVLQQNGSFRPPNPIYQVTGHSSARYQGGGGKLGGNQPAAFGGNTMCSTRPQTTGLGNRNGIQNFGGAPPAKRPNLGQPIALMGNTIHPNMPEQSNTFRQQNTTFPTGAFGANTAGQWFPSGQRDFGNTFLLSATFVDTKGFGEGEIPLNISPLVSLSPYQNGWTIRVYVKDKDPLRWYQNAKGQGTVFGMWLQDDTDAMKCTAFGAEAIKFHEMMAVGKWYYIRNASVSEPKDSRYSRGKQYEMSMRWDTLVKPCLERLDRPKIWFHFSPISKLGEMLAGAAVDVIGICSSVTGVAKLRSRAGKNLMKREIVLRDQEFSVGVTLWGPCADQFEGSVNQLVAIKGCIVSDFCGRTLSTVAGCDILVDPDIAQAHILRGWYQTEGASTVARPVLTQVSGQGKCLLMVNSLQAHGAGLVTGPKYFPVKATIMNVDNLDRPSILYRGCPGAAVSSSTNGWPQSSCNRKVVDAGDGLYRCEKCQKDSATFVWRLLLQIDIADFGGNVKFVTVFQEQAEQMIKRTAQELGELYGTDRAQFDKAVQAIVFKSYIFHLSAKSENYQEQSRIKFSVVKVDDLDFEAYSKHLAKEFKLLTR